MKKLLLILLSVPLLFSCDNKKEEAKKNEQETLEEIQTSTRIDTIYGVTFMALAPENSLVKLITQKDRQEEVVQSS